MQKSYTPTAPPPVTYPRGLTRPRLPGRPSLSRLRSGAAALALSLGLTACVDLGPHAPLTPLPAGSPVVAACRSPSPLPSGRLFTDITEQAGLKGITGVRVASADLNGNLRSTPGPYSNAPRERP